MFNHEPKGYDCPFCAYVKDAGMPYMIHRDKYISAFISSAMWPHNPGIVIIIPNKHYENIYDIPESLLSKTHILAKRVAIAMKKGYKCDGVSTRQHNEPAGNQEIWHYHFQVLPRYKNDRLYLNHDKKSDIPEMDRLKMAIILKKNI